MAAKNEEFGKLRCSAISVTVDLVVRNRSFASFIHITVEQGIIGLIIFALIIFSVLARNRDNPTIKSAFLALLTFSCFSYPSSVLPLKILFPLFIGILATDTNGWQFPLRSFVKYTFTTIVLSFFTFTILQNIKYKKAYTALENPQIDGVVADNMKNDRFYIRRYSDILFNNEQYAESLPLMIMASQHAPSSVVLCKLGDIYNNLQDFDKAEECYIKAHLMTPAYIEPLYKLFILYQNTGNSQRALSTADQILNMNVKVVNSATLKVRSEVRKYKDIMK